MQILHALLEELNGIYVLHYCSTNFEVNRWLSKLISRPIYKTQSIFLFVLSACQKILIFSLPDNKLLSYMPSKNSQEAVKKGPAK